MLQEGFCNLQDKSVGNVYQKLLSLGSRRYLEEVHCCSRSKLHNKQTDDVHEYARNSLSFERWNRGLMSYRILKVLVYGVIHADLGVSVGPCFVRLLVQIIAEGPQDSTENPHAQASHLRYCVTQSGISGLVEQISGCHLSIGEKEIILSLPTTTLQTYLRCRRRASLWAYTCLIDRSPAA